jgi:excisionase family DNA binding protein
MTGRLLTAKDVAERLQLPIGTIYAMARKAVIPHHRFGRTVRFRPEAIDEWLRASERATLDGSK